MPYLAKINKTTVFSLMLSILMMLLSRLSGQKEVVVGILGAGREHPSLHNIVGFLVNTLILSTHVSYDQSFADYLSSINGEVVETLQHQSYPLELVLDFRKPQHHNQ